MLLQVKRTFVDGPFGQIHARVARPARADKAAIVCLHMSPKSGRDFADVMPYLALDRAVVAPDNPGHGESDLPPVEPPVTVEDYAQSAWHAVDALVSTPVHLIGYHTGSMVALEMIHSRPQDVASVVNISAPVYSASEQTAMASYFDPIPLDEEGSRFRINWERAMQHRGPGVTLEMLAASYAENLRAGDAYEWGHRAAFAYVPTYNERLKKLEHPLFVMNINDICFDETKRAQPLIRNGRYAEYLQWGQGFLNAFPREAAGELNHFIEDVEGNE
ncbi:MAG: alpha/beta fold hydrolase [Woeseiaceae bacterium]|nr:alpha/beta fold hydrolase [Woeseiaceae bacterium]